MACVYQITFSTDPDQWKYFGKANVFAKRMREHVADSRRPWSKQVEGSIDWAIKWLGVENMVAVKVESGLTSDEAFAQEEVYIDEFDTWLGPGWNLTPGGEGHTEWTDEQKAANAEAHKRLWEDPVYRQKQIDAGKRRMADPEARRKLSEAAHSPAACAKVKAAWARKSQAEKDKQTAGMNTPEAQAKSAKTRNRPEVKAKLSKAKKRWCAALSSNEKALMTAHMNTPEMQAKAAKGRTRDKQGRFQRK